MVVIRYSITFLKPTTEHYYSCLVLFQPFSDCGHHLQKALKTIHFKTVMEGRDCVSAIKMNVADLWIQ